MNNAEELQKKMLALLEVMDDEETESTYKWMKDNEVSDFIAAVMVASESLAAVMDIDKMNISTDAKIRKIIERKGKAANG